MMVALVFNGSDHCICFPCVTALLTHTILVTTDSVFIFAELMNLHTPQDLETLIESESLLNWPRDLSIEGFHESWGYLVKGSIQLKSKACGIGENSNQSDFILNDAIN
jgi:hypothetical protein